MKCNYCNTELKQGAKFCPNCGKEVLEYEVCISCGEKIKIGAQFCPHCGANQAETIEPIQQSNTSVEEQPTQKDDVPIQNEEVPTANESRDEHVKTQQLDDTVEVQNNSSKKWLLIIPLIILIVGAGAWYLFSDGFSFGDSSNVVVAESVDSDSIAEVDEIENDPVAVEAAEARQAMEEGIKELEEEEAKSEDEGYDSTLSERELTEEDLEGKTKKELELMRNSIYARYGYRFKRDDLFSHFSQFNWYNPTTSDMSTVYSSMSGIEKYNIDFIKKHE